MADNERQEFKVVTDWNQVPDGEAVTLDYTEDAWEYGAPPPRGVYDLQLFPQKDGIKWGLKDEKDPKSIYYTVAFEARVKSENPDYDGTPAFGSVNTRVYRGKDICTAAGLLTKAGARLPNPITDKQLAKFCDALLRKEIIIKGELDWRGSYQYRDAKGNDVWENCFNHFEEFPEDKEAKDGSRKHLVSVTSKGGGLVEVRAQLKVTRFFGKGDELPKYNQGALLVSMPRSAMPQPIGQAVGSPIPASAPAFVQQQVQQPVNAGLVSQTGVVQGGGDIELMLE
jgi:hypothetical protein